jgi:hypothetical protein
LIAAPVINAWAWKRWSTRWPAWCPALPLLVSAAVTAVAILPLTVANRLHRQRKSSSAFPQNAAS